MLFVLGVGTAVGLQSSIVTNLMDVYPKAKNWKVAGVCAFGGFLVGLMYVTPGGQWMFKIVDHFGGTFLLFFLVILELMGILWVYGLENFCWDLEFMLNKKVTTFWRISWFFVTPLLMIAIFVYSMAKYENPTYLSKQFPTWSLATGWCIFASGVAQIFIWAFWTITRKQFDEKPSTLKSLFQLNKEWGPKSPKIRKEWLSFKAEKTEQRRIQSVGHSKWKQFSFVLLGKYE